MMRIFRRAPVFFGWIVFELTLTFVLFILGIVIGFGVEITFPDRYLIGLDLLLMLFFYIVIGFSLFAFTVEKVVLPLCRPGQESPQLVLGWIKPYFRPWVRFLLIIVAFYALMVLINLLHETISILDTMVRVLNYIWVYIASFISFRITVRPLVLLEQKK